MKFCQKSKFRQTCPTPLQRGRKARHREIEEKNDSTSKQRKSYRSKSINSILPISCNASFNTCVSSTSGFRPLCQPLSIQYEGKFPLLSAIVLYSCRCTLSKPSCNPRNIQSFLSELDSLRKITSDSTGLQIEKITVLLIKLP